MQLTENFSLHEMTKSEAALRHNIDNTPSDDVTENLYQLCANVLQPIRDAYQRGVKVNSGYRGPEVNAAIGGAKNSDHMRGMAADIEIPGVANSDLAEWIRDNLDFTQVILEFYTPGVPDSGWVHVSYDANDLRKQCLTAVRVAGKTSYQNGLLA